MERQGVLFDLDGTLLDSEPIWKAAMASLVRSLAPGAAASVTSGLSGIPTAEAVALVHSRLGLVRADIRENVDRLEREVAGRQAHDPGWRPGVPELLTGLRGAGFGTALVTSNSRVIVDGLLAGGLRPLFDTVVCLEDVARAKPAPDPYREAVRRLGLRPGDCVAVEDSAVGVASALAAGCAVVRLGVVGVPHADDVPVVANLADLDVSYIRKRLDGVH
ncbi:HAD family hydrolase [Actinoplanes sp. G11-F43]|uniref:HAD family hydrolase n=1 Tax=Actinoplanes sp. G11-F43 TaxID=3424130 RepID=UPI003D352CFF